MGDMRHRDGKLKIMHTIIGDFAHTLRKIATLDEVESILTGTISPSKSYSESMTFQYFTDNGIKLLAKTTTAVQEIFIVTASPDLLLDELYKSGFIEQERTDVHHNHPRKKKRQVTTTSHMRDGGNEIGEIAAQTRHHSKKNNKDSGPLPNADPLTLRNMLHPDTLSALMKLKENVSPQSITAQDNKTISKKTQPKAQKQQAIDPDEDFASLFAPKDDEESFEEMFNKSKLDSKFFK